jgi:predicted amidohydrolase YtcJ
VTSITDATPTNDPGSSALLAQLPQRVRVMGPLGLVTEGEVKVMLDDDALPPLAEAQDLVGSAHAMGRGVAVHCVTLVQLWFAIEMFRGAGVAGDRIEHASVAPAEAIGALRALSLRVVTQPGFVAERGDDYLRDVEGVDRSALYPLRSLLRAGIPVRGSSDAPFGGTDCWAAMRAAVERRTASGRILLPSERLDPHEAVALFSDGYDGVRIGAPADLAVLAVPLDIATRELDSRNVVATIVAGRLVALSP